MKKIVILTGAGISKESGIDTFRDSGGTWEKYNINDVATPKGWLMNPELVLDFYNQRRQQVKNVMPNEAHKQLARLEKKYEVKIITQNIDDLHERGGSSDVLHIHGEIKKAKSCGNHDTIKDIGYDDIKIGDLCEEGFQMRPDVVWFGESVDKLPDAESIAKDADIFLIIGTSLNVYPAAGLVRFTRMKTRIYVIDPSDVPFEGRKGYVTFIKKPATEGVKEVVDILIKEAEEVSA